MVFLQHPRERRVAIGTARMAHLALPNSELHLGVEFGRDERLQQLLSAPGTRPAVLYPTEHPDEPARLPESAPNTLVVIDGTWTQARKVLNLNPWLQGLPRIGLRPSRPGNYRIRKEPAEHCLSTIEAVVDVLGKLEGEPERFSPMLAAFERMVDRQLECQETRVGPARRKRRRTKQKRVWTPPQLTPAHLPRVVLVHAEANAPTLIGGLRFDPELVHLCAQRPSTGERFEAVVAPRQPLTEGIPRHLELPAEQLLGGEPVAPMLERWRQFLGPDAILAVWGGFARQLLEAEGEPARPFVDLRLAVARKLSIKVGGVDGAAERLSPRPPEVWASGRGGRRLASLARVFEGLLPKGPAQ